MLHKDIKLFPVSGEGRQIELHDAIIKVLMKFRFLEKFPDMGVWRYSMDIMVLFHEFLKEFEVKEDVW